MFEALRAYQPQKFPWIFLIVLTFILSLQLLAIPFLADADNPTIYELFYRATQVFLAGGSPYAAIPGFDLFKYGPSFLILPLIPLSFFSLEVASIFWQLINVLIFAWAMLGLMAQFRPNTPLPYGIALVFPLMLWVDFQLNGTYLQSNAWMLSLMLLGFLSYLKGHWWRAAIFFGLAVNMKILPIVVLLLLFLDFRWVFIFRALVVQVFLLLLPYLIFGWEHANFLYSEWLRVLLIDKEFVDHGSFIHYYIGLRPFLAVNFGWVLNEGYFLLPLISALVTALLVLVALQHPSQRQAVMAWLLIGALSFILIFNPRTEGPSLVLMAPIYVMLLWLALTNAWIIPVKVSWVLILGIFLLTSLSTTDLFKGTFIHDWSWYHNLRFLGFLMAYFLAMVHLSWIAHQAWSIKLGIRHA